MNREKLIQEKEILELYKNIHKLNDILNCGFQDIYQRELPFEEAVFDRWERAKRLGFGKGTSVYNSSIIFYPIKVGKNCWIGPNTILDGSGGLEIGNFCTISCGVQVYSHNNVLQTLSSKTMPIERAQVTIGNNVYIGPNTVISSGTTIGNYCVIGVGTFVNKDLPSNSIAVGQPARIIGEVEIQDNQISLKYF